MDDFHATLGRASVLTRPSPHPGIQCSTQRLAMKAAVPRTRWCVPIDRKATRHASPHCAQDTYGSVALQCAILRGDEIVGPRGLNKNG